MFAANDSAKEMPRARYPEGSDARQTARKYNPAPATHGDRVRHELQDARPLIAQSRIWRFDGRPVSVRQRCAVVPLTGLDPTSCNLAGVERSLGKELNHARKFFRR